MRIAPVRYLILSLMMVSLLSCVTSSSQSNTAPQSTPLANPPKKTAQGSPSFDHQSSRDTVAWASTNSGRLAPKANAADRERLGEQLGLIGPIVSTHGVGSKRFILVYDSAGVQVGGLTYKAFKKEPQRFEALIKKAQKRSEHQNFMAMRHLMYRQLATQMAAQREKEGGRHDK